jgi:periplasmic divalent cation tolerance protein
MSEFIEIHWTTGSIDEARKVARYLVQEKLVACAQITPWIESIYSWNGQIETSQESKVAFKTLHNHYDAIKEIIKKNTSYQVPEISYTVIDGCNKEYLEWVESSILTPQQSRGG